MFCLIKFLKSLDLRGFLAIAGTLLFVFVWSLFDPVSAYFVCKMLAWANLVLSTEFPNNKIWVLIKTPIDSSATDSVLLGIDNSIKLLTCFYDLYFYIIPQNTHIVYPWFGQWSSYSSPASPLCYFVGLHQPALRMTAPVVKTFPRPGSFTWYC